MCGQKKRKGRNPAFRALSGEPSEGGHRGLRKDPIVATELRVRRPSDTGILLKKAAIVQRHKKR